MNSSYGKLLENCEKYKVTKIQRFDDIKKDWINPFLKTVECIGDNDVFEINSQKRRLTDDKLCHVGLAVLHQSKLRLMSFIYFLEKYLMEGAYKICYLGEFL